MNDCSLQSALCVLQAMSRAEVAPNDVSFNTALSACEQGHCWGLGLVLLHDMASARPPRDAFSYSSAISACEHAGRWEVAGELLDHMSLAKAQPNLLCFSPVLRASARCEAWGDAVRTLGLMWEVAVIPDVIAYEDASMSCESARSGESLLLLLAQCEAFWLQQMCAESPVKREKKRAMGGSPRAALFEEEANQSFTSSPCPLEGGEVLRVPQTMYVEKLVEVPKVEKPVIQCIEKVMEVPQYTVQVTKQVPRVEIQTVDKEVRKREIQYVEKIVVPQVVYEERIVEVPRIEYREVIKQVPKPEVQYIDKKATPCGRISLMSSWTLSADRKGDLLELPLAAAFFVLGTAKDLARSTEEILLFQHPAKKMLVAKPVPKHVIEYVEKIVEVPQVVYEERPVEVEQVHTVEALTEIPKPVVQTIEKQIPRVPTTLQVEQPVEERVPTEIATTIGNQSPPRDDIDVQYVDREVPNVTYQPVEQIVEVPQEHCSIPPRALPPAPDTLNVVVRHELHPSWLPAFEKLGFNFVDTWKFMWPEVPQVQLAEFVKQVPKQQIREVPKHIPRVETRCVEKIQSVPVNLLHEVAVEVPQVLRHEVITEVQGQQTEQRVAWGPRKYEIFGLGVVVGSESERFQGAYDAKVVRVEAPTPSNYSDTYLNEGLVIRSKSPTPTRARLAAHLDI
ncbi:Pentatricopeptide repeat-containing protein, chloroplastic [Symbiodinium microadriaticum]|uniref:Pentatricopeptide repeat-containing protein, chloroplastic n=1 Tax=Symbiodinium microadriaticum TaxID=2951 RepID=A0A1Q9E2N1_SYMMI|nr:Pentatricopeptide repeat-containing protein, chloroplastic [Symbiodinium microadriaticum]